MIKIYPEIECDVYCPNDCTRIFIKRAIITGMRCLADYVCPTCGSRFYTDLSVSHALSHPVTLNQETAEIYDSTQTSWFSNPLRESFLNKVTSEIVPIVHKFFDADQIVIINCLDFLYGHSLLILLNVQYYLDHFSHLGCCVLVPTSLVHLVPDGVAEIWEFPVSIKDGWKWYLSLESWVNQQFMMRKECFLSRAYAHPSPDTYNLTRFVRNLPDIPSQLAGHKPIVLFSYREDRLWGRSLTHQQRNLQKLYNKLSVVFPEMAFVLVGFGKHNQIQERAAQVIDLRTDSFSVERDRLWMAYMQAADCAIGVHGSNMLLPSGLAKSTIELVPASRFPNTVQDFLFSRDKQDVRDGLLFYRMLYGNETLSDIQPSIVGQMVATVLSSAKKNSVWFKAGEDPEILKKEQLNLQDPTFQQASDGWKHYIKRPWIKRKLAQAIAHFANTLLEIVD